MTLFLNYFFYKNFAFAFSQFIFAFFCGFTAQVSVDIFCNVPPPSSPSAPSTPFPSCIIVFIISRPCMTPHSLLSIMLSTLLYQSLLLGYWIRWLLIIFNNGLQSRLPSLSPLSLFSHTVGCKREKLSRESSLVYCWTEEQAIQCFDIPAESCQRDSGCSSLVLCLVWTNLSECLWRGLRMGLPIFWVRCFRSACSHR